MYHFSWYNHTRHASNVWLGGLCCFFVRQQAGRVLAAAVELNHFLESNTLDFVVVSPKCVYSCRVCKLPKNTPSTSCQLIGWSSSPQQRSSVYNEQFLVKGTVCRILPSSGHILDCRPPATQLTSQLRWIYFVVAIVAPDHIVSLVSLTLASVLDTGLVCDHHGQLTG